MDTKVSDQYKDFILWSQLWYRVVWYMDTKVSDQYKDFVITMKPYQNTRRQISEYLSS